MVEMRPAALTMVVQSCLMPEAVGTSAAKERDDRRDVQKKEEFEVQLAKQEAAGDSFSFLSGTEKQQRWHQENVESYEMSAIPSVSGGTRSQERTVYGLDSTQFAKKSQGESARPNPGIVFASHPADTRFYASERISLVCSRDKPIESRLCWEVPMCRSTQNGRIERKVPIPAGHEKKH